MGVGDLTPKPAALAYELVENSLIPTSRNQFLYSWFIYLVYIMSAYKEKSIWKMNILILYRSLPVLLAIIGLVVIFFPYTFLPDYLEGEIEDARSKCVNMIHGLLLLGSLLPCLVLLPAWVEENSRELLHAMAKNKALKHFQMI